MKRFRVLRAVVCVSGMALLAGRVLGAEMNSGSAPKAAPELTLTNQPPAQPAADAPPAYNSYLAASTQPELGDPNVSYEKNEYGWMVSMDIRQSETFGGDIKRLTHITLAPLAFEEDTVSFSLFVGGARVEYESGSGLDQLTKDPWLFEAGLASRKYFNSPRNGFSPFLGLSLAYQLLGWDYRTPVIVDGEAHDSNALQGVEGTVSLGITTLRDSPFSAFGEVGIGGTVFICDTLAGFRNDLFKDFGFVFVRAGITFKF